MIIALIVLQLVFLARIWADGAAVNLAKVPYRREQRVAAIQLFVKTPSPQNKEAMQNEFRIASAYVGRRHLMFVGEVAAAVFIPEVIVFYLWKRRYKCASQSGSACRAICFL